MQPFWTKNNLPMTENSGFWSLFAISISLHGIQYAVDRPAQIFTWIFIVTGCLTYAIVLIGFAFHENIKDPFYMSDSDTDTIHAFDSPFPSITICANQFLDKWNLQRLVFNIEAALASNFDGDNDHFGDFSREFAKFSWLSRNHILKQNCETIHLIEDLVNQALNLELSEDDNKGVEYLQNVTQGFLFPSLDDFNVIGNMPLATNAMCDSTYMKTLEDVINRYEELFVLAAQIILYKDLPPVEDFGTLIAAFSEPMIDYSFHPNAYHDENMHIYLPYISLMDKIFAKSMLTVRRIFSFSLSGFPLIELPPLLEPKNESRTDKRPLKLRETSTRKIFYGPYNIWKSKIAQNCQPHCEVQNILESVAPLWKTLDVYFHDFFTKKVYKQIMEQYEDQLLFAPEDPDPQIDGKLVETEDATTNYYFLGRDYIQEWYDNNYAGEELKAEPTFVNLLVKFSMVLGNVQRNTPIETFLDIFQIKYSEDLDLEEKLGEIYHEGAERLELIIDCYTQQSPHNLNTLRNERGQCRDNFVPIITNKGLCSTINSAPLRNIFPNLQSVKEYSLVFSSPDSDEPYSVRDLNAERGMSLVLDIHMTDVYGSERGSFDIAVNSFFTSFEMTEQVITIFPGFGGSITIRVEHQDIITQSVLLNFDDKKNCAILNSQAKENLNFYSQKACKNLQAVEAATDIVGCVPFGFIQLKADLPKCIRGKVAEFQRQLLSNLSQVSEEDCPRDCNGYNYDVNLDLFKLNPDVVVRKLIFQYKSK